MSEVNPVRLDKFLWACRFFKTRSLATEAVNAGHVQVNDLKVKPAREVKIGDVLSLQLPQGPMTVTITALADRRGSATVAASLYEESEASRAKREQLQQMRQMEPAIERDAGRPTKRDRRQIRRFTGS